MEKNNHQVFTTGFTLGLLSGVAGYFLFGTKQGEKLRRRLGQEWASAQDYLREQGLAQVEAPTKLSEFWSQLKTELLDKLELDPEQPVAKKTKRRYTRHKKPQQFKGV